jgi:hypothetical protein
VKADTALRSERGACALRACRAAAWLSLLLLAALVANTAHAQDAATPGAGAASSGQQQAPFDPSGYWTSLVTEDWQYRMVVPQRGDYVGIPLNRAAEQFADAWNKAADVAAGKQCEAYGAGAIMLVPEHLHIQWQDGNTLKVQTDAGMQTRLLHFGAAPRADAASWQGDSSAEWMLQPPSQGGDLSRKALGFGVAESQKPEPPMGQLRIETTNLLPGLLRKNGLPYSDKARLLEYWEVDADDDPVDAEQLLIDTAVLSDPVYLHDKYYFNAVFQKLPDASRWQPEPCTLD